MENSERQRRLEGLADCPALRNALLALNEAEEQYESAVRNGLLGYQAINDAFQGFTVHTVLTVENYLRKSPEVARPVNHALLLIRVAACFRGVRAAHTAFLRGYSLQGFTLLRNVKDSLLMIAAVGNTLTTLTAINGLERCGDTSASPMRDMDTVRHQRINEERRVLALMLRGSKSGLDVSVQKELSIWEDLFNMEVHATLGTLALEGVPWMRGHNVSLLLHSDFTRLPMLTFTNRACEVAWMILRILPWLQITPGQFGVDWAETWRTLDDSFRFMSLGLAAEGKPIGEAIVKLLEQKFNFSPEDTYYDERMG